MIGPHISDPLFLHFDGHKIDLPDESVDRVICLDTLHHIPNLDEVISELALVLKRGGIAGFSEPGRFHSQTPQSQYEMKNYNVLENDIVISEIFSIAKEKRFTNISCKLLCNMAVSLDQYLSLTSNRLNSESTKVILDNICKVMTNKTIFFLYKGDLIPDSRSHIGLSHSISLDHKHFDIVPGEALCLLLRISNNGSATWLNENINDIGVVKIGTHLYNEDNELLTLDFSRHYFSSSTAPGKTVAKNITIRFSDVGVFRLAIDLVSEGICWFENIGSKPQYVTVNVK